MQAPSFPVRFRKMNGLGNDFVIIDARARALSLSGEAVRAIADRKRGIGCDQLILIAPSDRAAARMRIWNQNGAEVESCGNAARCVAALLLSESGTPSLTLETLGGDLHCAPASDGAIRVDIGPARWRWDQIPLAHPVDDTMAVDVALAQRYGLYGPSVVNVGNPHCVFWVREIEAHDLAVVGPAIERHPLFPERVNVTLAQVETPVRLRLKVWERGVGLTKACGTAACAAAAAAARKGLAENAVTVVLPGGALFIEWLRETGHVIMTGPVSDEYQGVIPPELFSGNVQ